MHIETSFKSKLFPDLYSSQKGMAIWNFLNESESIIRMQAVSDVGKPALLAIEDSLIRNFGIIEKDAKNYISDVEKSKNDSLKRMIGAMVRQVLEQNDYMLINKSVRVTNSKLFFSAALYKKRETSSEDLS